MSNPQDEPQDKSDDQGSGLAQELGIAPPGQRPGSATQEGRPQPREPQSEEQRTPDDGYTLERQELGANRK
jgi:hypothetical protein